MSVVELVVGIMSLLNMRHVQAPCRTHARHLARRGGGGGWWLVAVISWGFQGFSGRREIQDPIFRRWRPLAE